MMSHPLQPPPLRAVLQCLRHVGLLRSDLGGGLGGNDGGVAVPGGFFLFPPPLVLGLAVRNAQLKIINENESNSESNP